MFARRCARYHNDIHVRKMIIEYAQLLSTCHRLLGTSFSDNIYKAIRNVNHPSAVWVRQSTENYKWLYKLFKCLCEEYEYRFSKKHATSRLLVELEKIPENLTEGSMTPFTLSMPDYCKVVCDQKDDINRLNRCAIQSYQNYYNYEKQEYTITRKQKDGPPVVTTRSFAVWTNRDVPKWFIQNIQNENSE